MTLGKFGEPVSAGQLNQIFKRNKEVLDQAVEFECGHLSHFEVFNYERFCVLLGYMKHFNCFIILYFSLETYIFFNKGITIQCPKGAV